MIIIKWNWLRLIGSNLALLLIAQLIAAIPRDGNLFEEIFAQDPPQSYLGFNIPVEFDQGDEVSWDQQLRGININVICNRRDNFENKFRFFQDLKRKQELLKNDPGRQYVLIHNARLL
ncbi:hypothetical protein BDF19DRAFT_424262 [Syncephalis fuscata]|nr:hypothetical protein BDF19DRAFT_424262 [Syncephalis fuscata]